MIRVRVRVYPPRMAVLRRGLAVLAVASAVAALARADDPAPPGKPPAKQPDDAAVARELFTAKCAACHAPPDPAFAVERAWLDQVRSTA